MDLQQRQQQYRSGVEAAVGGRVETDRWADAYGFSNSCKIVDGGLFAFNVNLQGLTTATRRLVVNCVIRFPPAEAIYFSVVVSNDLDRLVRWLDEMKAQGTPAPAASTADDGTSHDGEIDQAGVASQSTQAATDGAGPSLYTGNSKNVKGYIGSTGSLHVRNKGFWDSLPTDVATIPGGGFAVDAIHFAVWPPELSERRSNAAREFVSYLGSLVGPAKVHEVLPWPGTAQAAAAMRVNPAQMDIAAIRKAVEALGGFYPSGEIERLHAALNFSERKHFAILSGLSGTGKSQLIQMYARAVHGITSITTPDPLLIVCPVRPDWTDPTGLTGYTDVLAKKYSVPAFLHSVQLALANPESPVYVVLDEMNLARVEYYFADVLSCMESAAEPLTLHTSGVPWEGSNGFPVPKSLPLPTNLYIVGTINVDETTHPMSDKVLDRAQVIDMSSVDLQGFLKHLYTQKSLQPTIDFAAPHLTRLHEVLTNHKQAFGYRVAEEAVRYISFCVEKLNMDKTAVLDQLAEQKLLVKLKGGTREGPMLDAVKAMFQGFPRATRLMDRLSADLQEFGSFQASR